MCVCVCVCVCVTLQVSDRVCAPPSLSTTLPSCYQFVLMDYLDFMVKHCSANHSQVELTRMVKVVGYLKACDAVGSDPKVCGVRWILGGWQVLRGGWGVGSQQGKPGQEGGKPRGGRGGGHTCVWCAACWLCVVLPSTALLSDPFCVRGLGCQLARRGDMP